MKLAHYRVYTKSHLIYTHVEASEGSGCSETAAHTYIIYIEAAHTLHIDLRILNLFQQAFDTARDTSELRATGAGICHH